MPFEVDALGMSWVVAGLVPSDVAPHPNFGVAEVTGPELLALLIQFKWREYENYLSLERERGNIFLDLPLLNAARGSLEAAQVEDAGAKLRQLSGDTKANLGQRTIAALLYSLALSDMDRQHDAITLLKGLIQDAEKLGTPFQSSKSLLLAILHQQTAMRLVEIDRWDLAREHLKVALAGTLGLTNANEYWESFETSRGVSWGSDESQRRIANLTLIAAQSLTSTIANFEDDIWADVVRSPYPLAAVPRLRETTSALEAQSKEVFDQVFPSNRKVWRPASDPVLRRLVSALNSAEMAGDYQGCVSLRRTIGQTFANRMVARQAHAASEAVRFLRKSGSDPELRQVLDWIQGLGPINDLARAAADLITVRLPQEHILSSDLTLISNSADLLKGSECREAFNLAVRFSRTNPRRDNPLDGAPSRERVETALRAIETILSRKPIVDSWTMVAISVLQVHGLHDSVSEQLTFSRLSRIIQHIEWENVADETRNRWQDLVTEASKSQDVLRIDLARANKALKGDLRFKFAGLELAAAVAEELVPVRAEELDQVSDILARTLSEVMTDAKHGKHNGYAWSPFALAPLFAHRHGREELWSYLTQVFAEPLIPLASKMETLQVLNAANPRVPLRQDFRQLLSKTIRGQDMPLLGGSEREIQAAFRRFRIKYNLSDRSQVRASLLKDSVSPDPEIRREAAAACGDIVWNDPSVEWAGVILIQLSYDSSARVKTQAAYQVGRVHMKQSTLSETFQELAREILQGPGILPPWALLSAIASTGSLAQTSPIRQICQTLALHHRSSIIRDHAQKALNSMQH